MPTLASSLIDGNAGRWLWLVLLHSLWLGMFVASAVALTLRARSRLSHATRHAVLVVSILLAAAGPLALASLQAALPARMPAGESYAAELTIQLGPGTSGEEGPRTPHLQAGPATPGNTGARPSIDLARIAGIFDRAIPLALGLVNRGRGLVRRPCPGIAQPQPAPARGRNGLVASHRSGEPAVAAAPAPRHPEDYRPPSACGAFPLRRLTAGGADPRPMVTGSNPSGG